MAWWTTSPRQAALYIQASAAALLPIESSLQLADYQKAGAARAAEIMNQRNGVLIADSVGLGKTFIGLALAEAALGRGERVLLVVPASLRPMWRKELRRLPDAVGAEMLSHTAVALGRTPRIAPELIVVDEAHAFRNPATRRYRCLRRLCRGCQVVLLTATPVNNSLSDLYFQLRLFCADGAFRDLGIGSLRAALLEKQQLRPDDIARLRQAVMVRRTRAQIRATADGMRFPRSLEAVPVSYRLSLPVPMIGELLDQLEFAAYVDGRASPELMRFGLLKRLESSTHALRATLLRQIRFHEQFLEALRCGRLLKPTTFRSLYAFDDSSVQLAFNEIALEKSRVDTCALADRVDRDLVVFRRWLAGLGSDDDKLRRLIEVLRARAPDAKTLVFTEFRDTARYLWRSLRGRFPTGLVDGSGAWIGESRASRRQVIERFAPVANGVSHHPREAIAVLIATDVLAEGMNLQDADAVVSYDLPWNPVKLIQRAGRIDRLGSPHEVVKVYNFIPDREFDAFLGLARTVRNKLETVRNVVGLDRPVLDAEDRFDEVIQGIARGDATVLDRIEAGQADPAPLEPPPGIPVAALADAPRRILLGLRRGARSVRVVIDLQTGRELPDDPAPILARAAECDDVPALPADLLARAEAYVRTLGTRPEPMGLGRRSVAATIARRIRSSLAVLPFGESSEVYDRADRVLCGLENVADVVVEDALAGLAGGSQRSLHGLLGAVESVLARGRIQSENGLEWELSGVIATD